eukprot:7578867-Pyramimonas_sp.AAC.1
MAGEHEQQHLRGILDTAYGKWVHLAWEELLGATHPQPKGRPGGQPPEFEEVPLRALVATKSHRSVFPGRALPWAIDRVTEFHAICFSQPSCGVGSSF